MVLTRSERVIRLKNFRAQMLDLMKQLANSVISTVNTEIFSQATLSEDGQSISLNEETMMVGTFANKVMERAFELIADKLTPISTAFAMTSEKKCDIVLFFAQKYIGLSNTETRSELFEEMCANAPGPVSFPEHLDIIQTVKFIHMTTVRQTFFFKVFGHIIQNCSQLAFI